MGTEGSGASRAGGDGFHNEDAFVAEEALGLYVVCDGASQAPAGEVAARVASEALEEYVGRAGRDLQRLEPQAAAAFVDEAMSRAMAAVAAAERDAPERSGLATTITLLLVHRNRGVIGHRGDSRAYLIRRDRAHQLTSGHPLTTPPSAGPARDSDADIFTLDLQPGDTIVLCTDGAEAVVRDDAVVRSAGDLSPHVLASRIVGAAHRRSPATDATAVVVRVRREAEPGGVDLSAPARGTAFGRALQRA